MTLDEAKTLRRFTAAEIEATGARLEDVQFKTFQAMDKFRDLLGRPVHLLPGGITTGSHKSTEHSAGLAVDCYLDGDTDPYFVFKQALNAGFNRVGIYWNGRMYSFHVALGEAYGFWTGLKKLGARQWSYGKLRFDMHLG